MKQVLTILRNFCFLFILVEVKVDEKPFNLTLCDTAGQDALDPLRKLCYPSSDVFILCFSVVNPETFRSIETKWIPELSKHGGQLLLIGTHSDLRTDGKTIARLQVCNDNLFIYFITRVLK